VLRRCEVLVATGWPVLVAPLDQPYQPPTLDGSRLDRGLALVALAAGAGVRVFHTPDVAATRRTVEMVASILGTRPPAGCVRGLA
jgi:dihydropteroate synthase